MVTLRRSRPQTAKAFIACVLFSATQAGAEDAQFTRLRADDLELAKVADRLLVANADRCSERMPATGLVIAAIDQFPPSLRQQAREDLGFAYPLGIEAIVPGSAADVAGLHAGDALLLVGEQVVAFIPASVSESSGSRDWVERQIISLPPAEPIKIGVARAGRSVTARLKPQPACRARFEAIQSNQLIARSDGEAIQLTSAFIEAFGEDAVAVAFAHELAHLVLHHGNKGGKRNEREADRLSVHLLAEAGYDPHIAPRFWRDHGKSLGARGHDSPNKRIELLEAEIAALGPARQSVD